MPLWASVGHGPTKSLLSDAVRERLQALYSRVPGVSCECDHPGECCELTEQEVAQDFATMYPLYVVEYLNIVDCVRDRFDPRRQAELLDITEERPVRCPFLTGTRACSIHSARPLVCRTYGVLCREEVERAASKARGDLPANLIWRFLSIERHTVCPGARALEPEKVAAHAADMISCVYQRELIEMGMEADGQDEARREALRNVSGKTRITRWTWGGFNVLTRSPLGWLERHFPDYWKASFLAE